MQSFIDDEGRIDFKGLAMIAKELESYVAFVAEYSLESHPKIFSGAEDILSYHINTYNALAIHGVIIEKVEIGFTNFLERAAFFKFHSVSIGGESTSLYDYENKVIRKFNEPRVRFVLNCMVRDCPRSPKEPFLADTLDKQLNAAAKEFFSKERYMRIDDKKRTIWLLEILYFYTEDFVASMKRTDLPAYINPYLEKSLPLDHIVRFINYN